MGRFLVEVHMREPEYDALSSLIPGFGESVEEVLQFIIADWLNRTLGMQWMQQHALVKQSLGKVFQPHHSRREVGDEENMEVKK